MNNKIIFPCRHPDHDNFLSGGQIAVTAWWHDSGSHSQYSFSKSKWQHRNKTTSHKICDCEINKI